MLAPMYEHEPWRRHLRRTQHTQCVAQELEESVGLMCPQSKHLTDLTQSQGSITQNPNIVLVESLDSNGLFQPKLDYYYYY